METGKCSIELLVILLTGYVKSQQSIKLTFYTKLGFEQIYYKPVDLLIKPLIDLVNMRDLYYVIE